MSDKFIATDARARHRQVWLSAHHFARPNARVEMRFGERRSQLREIAL